MQSLEWMFIDVINAEAAESYQADLSLRPEHASMVDIM